MKWMVPFNRLDAIQAQAVDDIDAALTGTPQGRAVRPRSTPLTHWVSGFAGSGKTIVLTHVAERLTTKQQARSVAFATYTHALKDLVTSGLTRQAQERIKFLTFDALKSVRRPFDVLVADEVQDITQRYFDEFKGAYTYLVAAADFDQRIFRQAAAESEVRKLLRDAREHQLHGIFRISENVLLVATAVHADANLAPGATVDVRDGRTQLIVARTPQQEWDMVYDEAQRAAAPQFPSAILFPAKAHMEDFFQQLATRFGWPAPPTKGNWALPADPGQGRRADRYGVINAYLGKRAGNLQIFGSGSGELATSAKQKTVYLMTYHSAKGLEFENVFLPRLCAGVNLQAMKGGSDLEERRLFFVAATRARRQLYLSYHGRPHRFIGQIPRKLLEEFQPARRGFGRSP